MIDVIIIGLYKLAINILIIIGKKTFDEIRISLQDSHTNY